MDAIQGAQKNHNSVGVIILGDYLDVIILGDYLEWVRLDG